MDNLRKVIKILFRYTSAMEVLRNYTTYDKIDQNSFLVLSNQYMPHYSNNEISNMRQFLSSEFQWYKNKIRGQERHEDGKEVNVFDAVLLFAGNVLVEENGKPVCHYEHILRWRDMIIELDEDLFVSSFFAQKDILSGYHRTLFFWSPVIGHNNKELNRMMEQGVAENHFHLKGSAPTFYLSWISMMNNVLNTAFKETLDNYEQRRLHTKISYKINVTENSLYISYLQAALIRVYLFACLKNDYFTIRTTYVKFAHIQMYILNKQEVKEKIQKVNGEEYIDIDELIFLLPNDIYKQMKQSLMRMDVETLLLDSQLLLFYLPVINEIISRMREDYAPRQLDYTICTKELAVNTNQHLNEIISGERWFLYEMFKAVYKEDINFKTRLNWFYAYLLIKENIRAELIQVNKNVGFNNFLLYQDRKENFIDGTLFEKPYLKMAVRDTILNQHIKILEARITPKNSANDLKKSINKNDTCILDGLVGKEREAFKEKFFYVCHFIKEKDEECLEKSLYMVNCRHYRKRQEVKQQAKAIYECRRKYKEEASRILGIDAASEEIVCRPEVFAQAYRFLKNDSMINQVDDIERNILLSDLSVTYHAGEDFLDILDGLRAIDEAISFLNLDCGDRIGHALALGVDVDEWYSLKSDKILISQMDYIDNLVWLYAKIRKYRIEGCEDAIRYIEKRYNEYFRIVYLNNMSQAYFESVVKRAQDYYNEREIKNNYSNTQCYFSINTYYDSWKLRGDNPEYFRDGFFVLDSLQKDEWGEQGINKIFPENYRIRYNPEAAYLYHVYHYNGLVRREGEKKREIKINISIKKAVNKVQKRLQLEVAQRGICIETNPSSNALIGTFKRYDKHPILNWYNVGLVINPEEIQKVPQIQVSINTDDQGVFATYIENEYAYLALALEKMRDENGNPKYSRTLIYQWLDNIRKMGLSQCFAKVDIE